MTFIPADLFDLANVGDPWPQGLARFRRLLVTTWLLNGDQSKPATAEQIARARGAWDVNVRALDRPGRVTVVTTLVQLQEMGFVRAFEVCEGGFAVELVKEAA